jgi:DNA invertase Pin-like site-specific DNA recombinase
MAYLRTSLATNVGPDKDSDKRQREAIRTYAKHAGYELVGEFYDAAVSGADPIDTRPGFMEMMTQIAGNGVRTVIVEDASRFACTLMVQEAGIATLAGLGVRVLTSRGDDLTESDDEMRVAMRQIAGVFSQLEKTRLVKKLKAARERIRTEQGKCEGRKAHAVKHPDAVLLAKRLHRASPLTGERRSLRKISAAVGFVNERGQPYHAQSVRRMIEGHRPTRPAGYAPGPDRGLARARVWGRKAL